MIRCIREYAELYTNKKRKLKYTYKSKGAITVCIVGIVGTTLNSTLF